MLSGLAWQVDTTCLNFPALCSSTGLASWRPLLNALGQSQSIQKEVGTDCEGMWGLTQQALSSLSGHPDSGHMRNWT